MPTRFVIAAFALALALVSSAAFTQENVVQKRNGLMRMMWNQGWRPVTFMVRGREPYDQAKVDAGCAKLEEIGRELPPLWPAGTEGTAPNANFVTLSRAFENKADFDAKLADFNKAVAETKGKATDLDSL
ncbi:MAG: cytochrome c, partial [Rhizobiales bacterium]|nr:cytochrome c [Hyphomicrobiales bacterium]